LTQPDVPVIDRCQCTGCIYCTAGQARVLTKAEAKKKQPERLRDAHGRYVCGLVLGNLEALEAQQCSWCRRARQEAVQ
jgi:hypothetical protein